MPLQSIDLSGLELTELFDKDADSPIKVALKKAFLNPEFIEEYSEYLRTFDNLGVLD